MFSTYGMDQKRAQKGLAMARRRRGRITRAGQGMRASQSDTRAASQAFERMHTHASAYQRARIRTWMTFAVQ